MADRGKKYQAAMEQLAAMPASVDSKQALGLVKKVAHAKFDETVGVDVTLGIDPEKSEQAVRGSVLYPHGIGKKVRVVVFAKGKYADEAAAAGADYIGVEDMVEKIEGGWLDFDCAVATPDQMGVIGRLAKILGPRGLLPNKKTGTVTFDVTAIIKDLKGGRTFFKSDRGGLVHLPLGKVSFDEQKLHDNFVAFMKALIASRPATAKGRFVKKVIVSSTMGPGVLVELDDAFKV